MQVVTAFLKWIYDEKAVISVSLVMISVNVNGLFCGVSSESAYKNECKITLINLTMTGQVETCFVHV